MGKKCVKVCELISLTQIPGFKPGDCYSTFEKLSSYKSLILEAPHFLGEDEM